MSGFSPVNTFEQPNPCRVDKINPSHISLDPTTHNQTKIPLRDAILTASNALESPVKKRRVGNHRDTKPRLQSRLCTPPTMFQDLGTSEDKLSHEHWPGSEAPNGRPIGELQQYYDDLSGGYERFNIDSIDHIESSDTEVNDRNDDRNLPDSKQSTLTRSSPLTISSQSNGKENIPPSEDFADILADGSSWEDEFPTDASIFNEINVDFPVGKHLPTPQSPSQKPKKEKHEPTENNQASWTKPVKPEGKQPDVIDLTLSSPDKPKFNSPPTQAFVRSTFPKPLRRSDILPNLSPAQMILSCFRMVDILRATSSKPTNPPLLEVFASVTSSHRIQSTQQFIFSDLFFPSRPPHLPGEYIGWQGVDLFEADTLPFLKAKTNRPIRCRAVCYAITPKREDKPSPSTIGATVDIKLKVLNIWPASQEDVEYSKRMVL